MTDQSSITECHRLLDLDRLTRVADIGANLIDDDRPYQALLDAGLCQLIGLEPQAAAFDQLTATAGENEHYLPYAVGDGETHMLNICRYSGWTSFLTPSRLALAAFPFFTANAEVIDRQAVATRRMDDIAELRPLDFLKIDIQGAELMAFQSGANTLANLVALQTEVSFIPLYDDQPTLGEIDRELRQAGMIPFTFLTLKPHGVLAIEGREVAGSKQLLEGDMLYVRDYTRPDRMSRSQLGHLALLMHSLGGFELAHQLIALLEGRGELARGAARDYLAVLSNARAHIPTIR